MEYFHRLMDLVIEFMHVQITMGGFTFSPWGIFLFVCFGIIVMHFIGDFFGGK